jgi:dihydrofolate reductase
VGRVIVIEFVTLDGVLEDPDGGDGTAFGGWAFRYGPETVAGDKFRLGALLDTGTLLLGRETWERFARIWPARDDAFADVMNRMPKLVASRSLEDVGAWSHSTLIRGDLVDAVAAAEGEVIVVGSAGVAQQLMHLVDEYRLLVFPLVLGQGRRLFERGAVDLALVAAEPVGAAVLLTYRRRSMREPSARASRAVPRRQSNVATIRRLTASGRRFEPFSRTINVTVTR